MTHLRDAWESSEVLSPSARAMVTVKLAEAYEATDDPRAGDLLRTASLATTPEGDYAALRLGIWLADRGGAPEVNALIKRGLAGLYPLSERERQQAEHALREP